MAYRLALPDLGEGVAEGEIVRWLVEPGDEVEEDTPLVLGRESCLQDVSYELAANRGLLGIAFPTGDVLIGDKGDRETLAHEFGHVLDFRKRFPGAEKDIQSVRPEGISPAEHYADVFESAVTFLQGEVSRNSRAAPQASRTSIGNSFPGRSC
jgi:hypothetical protein